MAVLIISFFSSKMLSDSKLITQGSFAQWGEECQMSDLNDINLQKTQLDSC